MDFQTAFIDELRKIGMGERLSKALNLPGAPSLPPKGEVFSEQARKKTIRGLAERTVGGTPPEKRISFGRAKGTQEETPVAQTVSGGPKAFKSWFAGAKAKAAGVPAPSPSPTPVGAGSR